MPDVVLLYSPSCPNVAVARSNLMRAFAGVGIPASWREVDLEARNLASEWRGYGSPTILVDGEDVADAVPRAEGPACRVYINAIGEAQGSPTIEMIGACLGRAAVRAGGDESAAVNTGRSGGWKSVLAMLPGIGLAVLPKVACPACWPAYAGILSALGLGALLKSSYLLPLTAVFLAVAVFALAFRASQRRGYGPFVAGLAAATLMMVGKFGFDSNSAMYGGVVILVAASLWNSWPLNGTGRSTCRKCVAPTPTGMGSNARRVR